MTMGLSRAAAYGQGFTVKRFSTDEQAIEKAHELKITGQVPILGTPFSARAFLCMSFGVSALELKVSAVGFLFSAHYS